MIFDRPIEEPSTDEANSYFTAMGRKEVAAAYSTLYAGAEKPWLHCQRVYPQAHIAQSSVLQRDSFILHCVAYETAMYYSFVFTTVELWLKMDLPWTDPDNYCSIIAEIEPWQPSIGYYARTSVFAGRPASCLDTVTAVT